MDEDFAAAMQNGARELADQTNLTPVRLLRAQGDQRRRRRAAGSVGLALVTAGAVGVGIVHFGGPGQHGHGPVPATTIPSTTNPTTTNPTTSESPDAEHPTSSATSKVSETPDSGHTSQTPTSGHSSATDPTSSPDCAMAQLKITLGQEDAGAGHSRMTLLFLNTGSTACRLHGYPQVKALDTHGHVMAQARQTLIGYMGGLPANSTLLPTVDLSPGQSASSVAEALNFNASDGSACTGYSSLLVTAPNETGSVDVQVSTAGCSDLQVHPIVPGDTGRSS